jgi:hypothetical protein
MRVQPIVEGHGEALAVPILLRRLRDASQAFSLQVNRPYASVGPTWSGKSPCAKRYAAFSFRVISTES